MSIAAAAPYGRHNRHFSYIKNFILSNFYGDNLTPTTQTPILEPEFEYELYKIPGSNDILIKTLKCKPNEFTIVDNSGEEIEIKPFESFIGTKSLRETDEAFRNVYKLLATRILNEPKISIFQTMVPIINGLHYEAGDHTKPFRVHPNKMQSVIRNEGEVKEYTVERNINEYINNLKRLFETVLKNLLNKRFPVNSYQERIDEQINVRKLPLPTNSYSIPKGENHMNNVDQYVPLQSENFKTSFDRRLVPQDSVTFPSMHFKKPVYIGAVVKDKHDKLTLKDKKTQKFIGNTPNPQDLLINDDSTTEDNHSKTNNSKATMVNHKFSSNFGIVKENDEVRSQSLFNIKDAPFTTTMKKLNNITINNCITEHKHNVSNVVKINNTLPKSNNISPHIHYNKTLKAKESKVHIKLGTDSSLPKLMTFLPIVEKTSINVHNTKSNDTKNETKENLTMTSNNKTKNTYKYTVGDEKLRDNANTSKNNYLLYNNQRGSSSKTNFLEASNRDDVKSNDENVNVVKSNNSHVSVLQTNDSYINVHVVKYANDVDNNIVIKNTSLVKTKDTAEVPNGANLSQLVNNKISYNDLKKPFGTFEPDIQVKTNVHTNSPLPQENSFKSPVIDTDLEEKFDKTLSYELEQIDNKGNIFNLDGNDVKTNAVSNTPVSTYNGYIGPITNSPPVNYTVDLIGDNKETSTTENATTISSTELFHGSEIGDRITSKASSAVKTDDFGNEKQDEESQNFSESFTKGRGDISSE